MLFNSFPGISEISFIFLFLSLLFYPKTAFSLKDSHKNRHNYNISEKEYINHQDSILRIYITKVDNYEKLKKVFNLVSSKSIIWNQIPSIFPVKPKNVKRISSLSGVRYHPIHLKYKKHNGVDFSGKTNTPIYSTADGIVIKSLFSKSFGNYIVIKHQFGFKTIYAHLNKRLVNKGDRIKQGMHIGFMGTTGNSTGVHLHYEVRKGGKVMKPLKFCLLKILKR